MIGCYEQERSAMDSNDCDCNFDYTLADLADKRNKLDERA